MNCKQCNTPIEKRKVPFGRAGYIELLCCECEAMKITLKYSNTGRPDNENELAAEGL
jgi:hypothetical protein